MIRTARIATLLLALLALTGVAAAESAAAGSWACAATTPNGDDLKFVLTVKEDGEKLAGNLTTERGQVIPIQKPEFASGVLTFQVELDSGTYAVELKPSSDKLEGVWKGGGESGKIKGSRKAS